jgi:hypothetical protein
MKNRVGAYLMRGPFGLPNVLSDYTEKNNFTALMFKVRSAGCVLTQQLITQYLRPTTDYGVHVQLEYIGIIM